MTIKRFKISTYCEKLFVLNYNLMILNSLIFTRIRGLLAVAITAVNGQPRIKYLRSKYQINFLLSTFPLSMILIIES